MKKSWLFLGCAALLCGCNNVAQAHLDDTDAIVESAATGYAPSMKMKRAVNTNMISADRSNSGSAFFGESSRLMAYTAGFTVVAKQQSVAMDEIKKLAESLGGYLLSRERGNMVLKVPVKKGDEFLKRAGDTGKITDFRISADDLTDTITDLNVRLANLRKLRNRLNELLVKAKNVEEILKVERELNRITTEIERLDAQLQNNQKRVDFVTFNVAVIEEHGALPGGNPQVIDQFGFLKKLSSEATGTRDEPLFGLDLPDDFVRIEIGLIQSQTFAAATSDDCILRTWEADVPDGSTLEFWQTVVCRYLSARKKYTDIKCVPVKFDGSDAVKITAQQTTVSGIARYMAIVSVERAIGDDELRFVEFFGPEDAFEKHEKTVSAAILK